MAYLLQSRGFSLARLDTYGEVIRGGDLRTDLYITCTLVAYEDERGLRRDTFTPIYPRHDATEAEFDAVIRAYERALTPPDRRTMVAGLAEVNVLTKQKAMDGSDMELTYAALIGRLGAYPADAVVEVLRRWPDRNTFFPSWHELKERLDREAGFRTQALANLKGARAAMFRPSHDCDPANMQQKAKRR